MIRGIIFDCFGVLCHGSLDYFLSRAKTDDVREKIIDTNHAADYGYVSHDEYISTIAGLLNCTHQQVSDTIDVQHVRNESVFEFAQSLRGSYSLGLLSNVGSGIIEQLFTPDELANLFDAVIISGEVGMVKPYPEIFHLTSQKLGLQTNECIMIDDLSANISGALNAGMQGIKFESLPQMKSELRSLLLSEAGN
jgi:HAD superfamily hydrolase (TIGR01549 family)